MLDGRPRISAVAWVIGAASCLGAAEAPAPLSPVEDTALVDEHRWVEAVSRRRQRVETAPQAVVVLDERDLTGTPAITLPDRLRYIAGIDVYQARHGQFDVGMRGYDGLLNNRVLVVVDGREFKQEEFGSVIWRGTIDLSDIERVEIIKGPSAVGYGANAFGGVIAIRGRGPSRTHQVHALAALGTPLHQEVDASARGPLGPILYYKVGAGATRLGDLPAVDSGLGHVPDPHTGDSGDADLVARRAHATLGARMPFDHRLEARYEWHDVRHWEFVDDLDAGSNDTRFRDDDVIASLEGPVLHLRHLHHRSDKVYQTQKTVFVPSEAFRYTQAGFINRQDNTRAQIDAISASTGSLSVGGEYDRWRSRSNLWGRGGIYRDRSTWTQVDTTNRALFAEAQYRMLADAIATGGVRYDRHSEFGGYLSPRVALNVAPDTDSFVLLSYSSGYRLPTPIESRISEYYFASDPDLGAETIHAVGLDWQGRFWRDDLALGAALFYNQSNRQIWLTPLSEAEMAANYNAWLASGPDPERPPGPFFIYRNLDNPADVIGAEVSERWRLPELPISLWSNATWQHYRRRHDIVYRSAGFADPISGGTIFRFDRSIGRDVDAPPEWKATVGATYDDDDIFGGLAARFVSPRRVFSFGNSFFNLGDPIEVQTIPAYAALDASIGYAFGPRRSRFVRASVLDVFDSGHYESFRARRSTLIATREQQYTSEIGRQMTLQVGLTF
ncbi:MAG: TonB-dependent receptor [Planctomycetes bacterium]|nr:TonB-dependent receptor [Planctomycetota bacterium]